MSSSSSWRLASASEDPSANLTLLVERGTKAPDSTYFPLADPCSSSETADELPLVVKITPFRLADSTASKHNQKPVVFWKFP